MANHSKPSVAWVTDLRNNPFETARLRLTAFYILVVAAILALFSVLLCVSYPQLIRRDLGTDRRPDRPDIHEISEEYFFSAAQKRLETTVYTLDAFILIMTAGLSYVLAGRTLRPIKEALDAQKEFSADASHEFRTPLAIIRSDSEIALKNPRLTAAEAKQVLQSNLEEVTYMSQLTERLLALARTEQASKDQYSKIPFDELVRESVEKIRRLAEAKRLSLNVQQLAPGAVLGNSGLLKEMLLNILQNAVDYTQASGSISIGLSRTGKTMRLTVEDSGIGITAKDLPHIFQRFYKSDQARTLKQGGGLGLSIVKDIVGKHHGKIAIESEPGKGTAVTVILPSLEIKN